jgi:hypothetical protein
LPLLARGFLFRKELVIMITEAQLQELVSAVEDKAAERTLSSKGFYGAYLDNLDDARDVGDYPCHSFVFGAEAPQYVFTSFAGKDSYLQPRWVELLYHDPRFQEMFETDLETTLEHGVVTDPNGKYSRDLVVFFQLLRWMWELPEVVKTVVSLLDYDNSPEEDLDPWAAAYMALMWHLHLNRQGQVVFDPKEGGVPLHMNFNHVPWCESPCTDELYNFTLGYRDHTDTLFPTRTWGISRTFRKAAPSGHLARSRFISEVPYTLQGRQVETERPAPDCPWSSLVAATFQSELDKGAYPYFNLSLLTRKTIEHG